MDESVGVHAKLAGGKFECGEDLPKDSMHQEPKPTLCYGHQWNGNVLVAKGDSVTF